MLGRYGRLSELTLAEKMEQAGYTAVMAVEIYEAGVGIVHIGIKASHVAHLARNGMGLRHACSIAILDGVLTHQLLEDATLCRMAARIMHHPELLQDWNKFQHVMRSVAANSTEASYLYCRLGRVQDICTEFSQASTLQKIGQGANFATQHSKNQTVYYFTQEGKGVTYVGRTNNFTRRMLEHMQAGKLGPPKFAAEGLTLAQARALEQVLIEEYGLFNLENKINSIASTNPAYTTMMEEGKAIRATITL